VTATIRKSKLTVAIHSTIQKAAFIKLKFTGTCQFHFKICISRSTEKVNFLLEYHLSISTSKAIDCCTSVGSVLSLLVFYEHKANSFIMSLRWFGYQIFPFLKFKFQFIWV